MPAWPRAALRRLANPAAEPAAPKPLLTNRAISPEARKLAEQSGLDIEPIEGSGRNGRITLQDVQQALRAPARPALQGALAAPEEDHAVFASPLARRLAALHGIALGRSRAPARAAAFPRPMCSPWCRLPAPMGARRSCRCPTHPRSCRSTACARLWPSG
jgi:pyruvate/2-oxoglutarate dehydrogenase complex dihydrolipoamide acyltransferase (E2) component